MISTKFLKIGEWSKESEINFIINYIRKATFLHMLPYARHFSYHVINFEIPPVKKFLSSFAKYSSGTAALTASSSLKLLPPSQQWRAGNRWWSDGARSEEYAGCWKTSHQKSASRNVMRPAVCGVVLSWMRNTLCDNFPGRFFLMASQKRIRVSI